MKVLFYFGHPAQYLFLRQTIKRLKDSGNHSAIIVIKTKDVLEDLIKNDGLDYINILPEVRRKSKFSIIISLLKRNIRLIPIVLKAKPDLMIGTDASVAHVGKLLGIKRITITEDDYDVISSLADLTYPFTDVILCPTVCDVGRWNAKKVGYPGYMKLGYLHPNLFAADSSILKKYGIAGKFVLIRLAKLTAHHDFGIKGISHADLDKFISILSENGFMVFISSEAGIPDRFQPFLLRIDPSDMHHVLAGASILISDSQSMSVEAAVLGVPSLRLSDFSGKISVLEELEHKFSLTFGIKPAEEERIIARLNELISMPGLKEEFQKRRKVMLSEKIDVSAFLFWFIENYPQSITTLNQQPAYIARFR